MAALNTTYIMSIIILQLLTIILQIIVLQKIKINNMSAIRHMFVTLTFSCLVCLHYHSLNDEVSNLIDLKFHFKYQILFQFEIENI